VEFFSQKRCRLLAWVPDELCWLSRQIRPHVHWHAASFLAISGGSALALLTPLVLKWLIDRVIPERNLYLLFAAVTLILLGSVGKVGLTNLGNFLMLSSAQKLGLRLRVNLLKHLDSLSADYYEETSVGSVTYLLKDPIEEVSYFGSDLLPAALRLVLTAALTLGTMFWLSPFLTVAVLPLIPTFAAMRQYFRRQLAEGADALQLKNLVWSSFLEEHISSVVPIQLLGQEKRQERKAFQFLAHAVRSQTRLFRTSACFTILSSLAVAIALCAVIGYGGLQVLRGGLSIGGLIAFYGFVTQLFEPLSAATELYARCQKTFSSVRQVQSAFALRTKLFSARDVVSLAPRQDIDHGNQIEFCDVEFAYPGQKYTFQIPALQIREGEFMGITGDNGAGKSTLGKLMVRLYDPLRGRILCGGQDIRGVQLESLRRHICYIPREPVLFDGTIASNLRMVKPTVTEQELYEAIQIAGLGALISSLPQGLQKRIGTSGCQLSGGQRQRLAIARAILQRPRVVILDEATSSLDMKGETMVLENLRTSLPSSSIIIVSHRSSSFNNLDRVLTLRAGRIVGDVRSNSRLNDQTVSDAWIPTNACR
jgi:ABC-type bacteriocin/lantibiotic exporter with double-glycine peptidase domain